MASEATNTEAFTPGPWEHGEFVVNDLRADGRTSFVYAPPGWHRKSDGTYGHDGSAGPEHGPERSKAYRFTYTGARRVLVGYLASGAVEPVDRFTKATGGAA